MEDKGKKIYIQRALYDAAANATKTEYREYAFLIAVIIVHELAHWKLQKYLFKVRYNPDGTIRLTKAGDIAYVNVPANVTLFIAILACVAIWALLWRTRLGYQIRAFGKSEKASLYAGINPLRITMIAMLISGGLAGLMAINNVMGQSERLLQGSGEGAGFIGIAVALMGRNHPIGVFLAALLFGFLYQGGASLGLNTTIPIEMRIVVQGLVILFTGALDMMVRMILTWMFGLARSRKLGAA